MRIEGPKKTFMLTVATLIDTTQLLFSWTVVLQHAIGFMGFVIFFLWFLFSGVRFSRPQRALTFFGSSFLEILVPLANVLPFLTFGVWWTIKDVNKKRPVVRGVVRGTGTNTPADEDMRSRTANDAVEDTRRRTA